MHFCTNSSNRQQQQAIHFESNGRVRFSLRNFIFLVEIIDIASTSNLISSPPRWISDLTRNIIFEHDEYQTPPHGGLNSDMIEAMELMIVAKTIPLIIQLNDIKRELNLMRMTINSLVEQVNETNDVDVVLSKLNFHIQRPAVDGN